MQYQGLEIGDFYHVFSILWHIFVELNSKQLREDLCLKYDLEI